MSPRPPPRRSYVALALALALSACVAHDKAGDRAAAVGDWRAAFGEYRQALADKPEDPALRQKFAEARGQALAASVARARACAAQASWPCALDEATFVVSVDPANLEMTDLARRAGEEVAVGRAREGQDLVARGDLNGGAEAIADAARRSQAPRATQAVRAATATWERAALAEVDRLRSAQQYPDAIALLQTGVALDPSLRPRRGAGEYEAFRTAEHDRLVAEGEGALAAGRFADAAERFRAARAVRPDDRAGRLEAYAGLLDQGDQALRREDWRAATRAYQDAAATGVDRSGYARTQLARVMPRPYAVRLKTVLVTPLRPDGVPWVGPSGPRVSRAQDIVSAAWGPDVSGRVVLALAEVPPQNRPNLSVEITLPGERKLRTPFDRALYTSPPGVVVVVANGFDRRRLAFRLLHEEPSGIESIAFFDVGLGELVARGGAVLQDRTGLLQVTADAADGAVEGSFTDLVPVGSPSPQVGTPGPIAPVAAPARR